jgi:plasmid stabilization system protein ParE
VTVEVRLRPEAEEDLAEAAAWYETQQAGLGSRFLDEVLAALATVADMPFMNAIIYRKTRRAWMRRFPFGIFYQVESDGVIVIAIIHGSRHPRRWQGRA